MTVPEAAQVVHQGHTPEECDGECWRAAYMEWFDQDPKEAIRVMSTWAFAQQRD